MARQALAVQSTVRTGLKATYSAAHADGHAFNNAREDVFLHVKNGGAGAVAVTIATPGTIDGLAIPDLTVSIPAGEDRFIGPFPKELYGQSDGTVHVNTDVQTSVTYAAIKSGGAGY